MKIKMMPNQFFAGALTVFALLLVACAGTTGEVVESAAEAADSAPVENESPTTTSAPEPTEQPPTAVPDPTATSVPPSEEPAEPTAEPPTATLETAAEEAPEETAVPVEYEPLFPPGTTADWTVTNDPLGIEGLVEVRSATEIKVADFIFLAAEAPGVDIRLGVDDDFSDGVGVSLKDITGKVYEGRSLTLIIPDEAFDGRVFNSIGVFCYDTDDLFDYAVFESS